jgi:hypothetical protein
MSASVLESELNEAISPRGPASDGFVRLLIEVKRLPMLRCGNAC